MQIYWPTFLGGIFGVALLSLTVQAEDISSFRFSAKVKVRVSANENIKGSVGSYINRELRSLNDVELVDSNPEWEINVLAMETKTVSGYKSGFVLSTVIINRFDNQMLLAALPQNYKEAASKMTSSLWWYPDHWVITGSTDDLHKLCKEIVADFDTKHLEESRKSFREIKEWLKNQKDKK
jgi:hypothetical protein